jgi:hypothetical protein
MTDRHPKLRLATVDVKAFSSRSSVDGAIERIQELAVR